jgi:multiple sugar transport system permease protein
MVKFKVDKHVFLLALPGLAYIITFTLYPILNNFYLSLQEQDIYGNLHWVGLANYEWFTVDPYFNNILYNTLLYSLATPTIDIILAIPIAIALKRIGGKWLLPLMVSAFIPWVTAAMAWYLFLNPNYGVGYYLFEYGIIHTNPMTSKWTIVLIDVWETLPTSVLLIYAGLKAIPRSIEEAAYADGLTGARKLLSVDLPLVIPNILTAFVLATLAGFFTFDPIYIGTSQAGPRILDDLAFYAYVKFFNLEPGYAAALIVLMTIISTLLSIAYLKLMYSKRAMRLPVPRFIPNKEVPKILHYTMLGIVLIFILTPFAWLLLVSLKTPLEVIQTPPTIIPQHISLENYKCALWVSCNYPGVPIGGLPFLITSLGVSTINVLITVLLAGMLAYAMSVHGFGGNKLVTYILYLTATPTLIYIIPLYMILRYLNIINTWWGLILTYPIMTIPYNTWILYNYYKTFPKQMEEAALADGMSRIKAFFRVVLPLNKPGLGVAAIYAFIFSWGALVFPLAFTYTPLDLEHFWTLSGAETYSIYIAMLMSPVTASYGAVAAAGILSSIPPLILLVIARNNLEKLWGLR